MARPRRPYRTLTPGRGATGMKTLVTALKDVNLTPIDGTTLLKAGETKVYDLNLQGMLRTYTQRTTFNNLITSGWIKVELLTDAAPTNPEGLENLTAEDTTDFTSKGEEKSEEDDVEDESSEEDDVEDESSEEDDVEDESSESEEEDEENADGEEGAISSQEETPTEPQDPLMSLRLPPAPEQDQQNEFQLTEKERRLKLIALEGLGETIVDKILSMESPTEEEILAINRFPKSREGLVEKVLKILAQ